MQRRALYGIAGRYTLSGSVISCFAYLMRVRRSPCGSVPTRRGECFAPPAGRVLCTLARPRVPLACVRDGVDAYSMQGELDYSDARGLHGLGRHEEASLKHGRGSGPPQRPKSKMIPRSLINDSKKPAAYVGVAPLESACQRRCHEGTI